MPQTIKSLTQAQIDRIPEWVDKWVTIGLSTEPADWNTATSAVNANYKLIDRQPPIILGMSSPFACVSGGVHGATLLGINTAHSRIRSQVYTQVYSQLDSQLLSQIYAQVDSQARSQVYSQVGSPVRSQVYSQVYSHVDSQLRSQVWYYYRGCQLWAGWYAYISFFRDVCEWDNTELAKFRLDELLALSCGWSWWHDNVCSLSDRPCLLVRDEQHRLHSTTGPALLYRDGWAIYSVHGTVVPQDVVEKPQELTARIALEESDTEVRRVMIERMGYQRFVTTANARLIAKDRFGKLWEIPHVPVRFVELINSTIETDGTRKVYFEPVPREIETPHQAEAWAFGRDVKSYWPEFES